jgi:hypothetical protein
VIHRLAFGTVEDHSVTALSSAAMNLSSIARRMPSSINDLPTAGTLDPCVPFFASASR